MDDKTKYSLSFAYESIFMYIHVNCHIGQEPYRFFHLSFGRIDNNNFMQ